jgi:endonuclease YncB( thermonuclease family)
MRLHLFMITGLLVSSSPWVEAQTISGRVVSIADGDTLTVLDERLVQHKVRLAEVDAPEIGHGIKKPGQPFGEASRQSLAKWCFGRQASVEVMDTDRYGRTVGQVSCQGADINLEQVKVGLAWAYQQYARRPEIFQAERQARSDRLGLWAEHATPPWEWRKNTRN